jgi:hypothetical protein
MVPMRNFTRCCLLLTGVVLLVNTAIASQVPSQPPLQYQLYQVRFSVLHQTGRGIPGGYAITIDGDGNGAYVENGTEEPKVIERKISQALLMELVNSFYEIHFFELQDTYAVKKQVLLKDHSTVATFVTKRVDIASTKLCVQLADYRKCVTIVDGQPVEAAQLAKKINALFER